jgi:hypothetical protein
MPDRYNSPVYLVIHPLNGEDSRENFSDLQMAWLRMIEIIERHGGIWDEHSFDHVYINLDRLGDYLCIACDDLQICIHYVV